MPKRGLAEWFQVLHNDRQSRLDEISWMAAQTKPYLDPTQDRTSKNKKFPKRFQSLGSYGTTFLAGKMLNTFFDPTKPWINLELSPTIKNDTSIPDRKIQDWENILWMKEMSLQAVLESTDINERTNRQVNSFRARKFNTFVRLIVTGDTLEQLTNDFRLKSFRTEQYVSVRDCCGDVLCHGIFERIDPLALEESLRREAVKDKSDDELKEKDATDRMIDLFTKVEWQPWSKTWHVRQEANGSPLSNEYEENISSFFSTTGQLVEGENYGRSIPIEDAIGDLASFDELRLRALDFAVRVSKMTPVIDYASRVRPDDFRKAPFEAIFARVNGGVPQDVGYMQAQAAGDYGVMKSISDDIRKDIGRVLLIDSEQVRDSERTTKYEVQEVALRQLDNATGGLVTTIADQQLVPLAKSTIIKMDKAGIPPVVNREIEYGGRRYQTFKIRALTGLEALSRSRSRGELLQTLDIMSRFGEPMLARIDLGILADVLMRYGGVNERGLVKSEETLAREAQAAQKMAAQAAATQQAIQSIGAIAETAALQNVAA